jgi:hypothetical protein
MPASSMPDIFGGPKKFSEIFSLDRENVRRSTLRRSAALPGLRSTGSEKSVPLFLFVVG